MMHATDSMGEAAHKVALLLTGFDLELLAASSPSLDRPTRADNLRRALVRWPAICRAMAQLEQTAPNVTRQAMDADAQAQDFTTERAA
jgi:hypothetical protein